MECQMVRFDPDSRSASYVMGASEIALNDVRKYTSNGFFLHDELIDT